MNENRTENDEIKVTGYDIALNVVGWIVSIMLIFAFTVILRSALRDHLYWIVMIAIGILGVLAFVITAAVIWYTVRNIRLAVKQREKNRKNP